MAGSLVVLGYAARLVGPTLATLVCDGILPDVRPDHVRYTYAPDHGFRLTLPDPAGWGGPDHLLRQRWCQDVIDAHLHYIIDAVRTVAPAATALLWGNVASGLVGALRTLTRANAAPLELCNRTAHELLDHGPLRGAGTLTIHNGQITFRRRTCCLFYRLGEAGTCGDCPLA